MKKIFCSLGLMTMICMFSAVPLQAADINVSAGGSIQAAITAASVGATINVAAGKYVENVFVNKKVTIVGAGAETTKIVATTGINSPLTFSTNGATVSGFTLTHEYTPAELASWNFNNNGVLFNQGSSNNTLSNCIVTLSRNGIYLNNTTNNVIDHNTITDNRTGFNVAYGSVGGNKITNNIISHNWTLGMVFYGSSDFSTIEVSGNTFEGNWYSEIVIKDSPGATGVLDLSNNTFTDAPVTYSTSANASLNEPSFATQKPVSLGGSATKPANDLPTLRIYNTNTAASLKYNGKTLMVGAGESFTTIQSAINAASTGDTINVAAGTYVEAVNINKALTLKGAGYGLNVIVREAASATESTIKGLVTVTASGVNINGFTLTNPGQTYAVAVYYAIQNINITYNIVDNVGSDTMGSTVHAINVFKGPDSVTIAHNLFNNIKASTKSANAIGVLDTTSADPSTGLLIEDNTFTNISSGKGVYGVIINNKAGTPGAVIRDNTFALLKGGWTHAIGLEGPTPNAVVTRNIFSDLTTQSGSPDNAAIFFQQNPGGDTVTVSNNQFNGTGFYGVAIHSNDLLYNYTVPATCNWWGTANGPSVTQVIPVNVTFSPWNTTSSGNYCNGDATTPPVVMVPANMTVEATSVRGALVTFEVSAIDNVDGSLTPTCTPASGKTFPLGQTTVICTATDSNNNTGTNSFTVMVSRPFATNKEQCKLDGWKLYSRGDGSSFKNQGDCVSYLNTGK